MRTQAIILKKIPFKEHDQLVGCYTREAGKQTYQAKSIMRAHSKQASHLDLLNMADFSLVHGAGYPIITSAISLRTFPGIKNSIRALAVSHVILECFDRLVFENQPDPHLWDFLNSELAHYEEKAVDANAAWGFILGVTQRKLLEALGYDESASIEHLVGGRLQSLHFIQKMLS